MSDDTAREVSARHSGLREWTARLAEPVGDPGGGAAAGVMLAMAASLAAMAAAYTAPERYEAAATAPGGSEHVHEHVRAAIASRAAALRERALELADLDGDASQQFGEAFRIREAPEREHAIREASLDAATSSESLGDAALPLVTDLEWLHAHANPAVHADVVVACAALRGALAGARANLVADTGILASHTDGDPAAESARPELDAAADRLTAAIARLDQLA
ncbi:cyclodeaminase/cyclohydrolase family protein [Herbiconiux sp. CPCC 203407]|uniref:Cyclodeaminase/cyclohydrolase family protein n=1 Tax=Herbiconiux oxytropis TaxID=2970915 RepID=A0AA42BTT5_9MICO|nr:cyclodeaminase/cyclohydrolase family protein [Herbiconiux oxytropis]MCS5721588.1 cyclodeaminase/cyclohydrolase family protein [Herbiconiux oxytropis]MCS5726785.1 cyclodeaminase/cyclohydrolase family protein [Herbiconiux oxytropis]